MIHPCRILRFLIFIFFECIGDCEYPIDRDSGPPAGKGLCRLEPGASRLLSLCNSRLSEEHNYSLPRRASSDHMGSNMILLAALH